MKQQFRGQLSNVELLARMFATATKRGIYANEPIYGQGLLNLGAATEPVGAPAVPSGAGFLNDEGGWQFAPVSATRMETGEAFGDALSRSFAGQEIAAFDSLDAPFWYPLETFALKTERSQVRRHLMGFMDFSNSDADMAGSISTTGSRAPVVQFEGNQFGGFEDGRTPAVYFSMSRGVFDNSRSIERAGLLSLFDNKVFARLEVRRFYGSGVYFGIESGERARRGSGCFLQSAKPASDSALGLRFRIKIRFGGDGGRGAFGELSSSTIFAGMGFNYELAGLAFGGGCGDGCVFCRERSRIDW